ncbi:MAG TPA: Spy/CpxP family protein refolding chaperone [Caldimonas sp.]|nr:Spy/CpxP family protein refolding chaperone [Caldimonas sp.]HEX4232727.1 Spy/CpxP family protein refolding chaperone [Caldimonas sp.]
MGKSVARRVATASSARRVQAVLIGMAVSLLAVISLAASAQQGPPSGMGEPAMHDRGMRMGHMDGMHDEMGGGMMFRGSPERMSRRIDRMLDGLGATDAQRSQIKQIAAAAASDVKAQAEAGRSLRQRALQAFTAPNVDAAAVEQVRQQMLQQHDQMSRRVTQAMLDVARVLTPEQRVRLGERIRDHQASMEDRMKRMRERMQRSESAPPASTEPRR